jgi:hypothetical protein
MRCTSLCLVILFSVVAVLPAAAQTGPPAGAPRLIISKRAIAAGLASAPAAPRVRSRDSVLNGAVIGAIAGAVSAAGFGGLLCHALAEEGDPPCWRSMGPILALGAGVGAAAGVGIDALHSWSVPIVVVRRR